MAFDRLTDEEKARMAERLKAARNLAGKTIQVAAAEIGVHRATYEQWEYGRSVPSEDNRRRVAIYYKLSEAVLFPECVEQKRAASDLLQQQSA